MNELLQKHGCTNVFSVPEGLKELMSDISREVLREQPQKIFDFIANYLSVLLITREHGIMATKILEDLCDCKPSVSEHLMAIGMERGQADELAQTIKEEIEALELVEGKEKVKETQVLKKILTKAVLDEDMAARVCQVSRNAYREYWYRKKLLEKEMQVDPAEPWEIAAEHTLELYKKTKPSFSELTRASERIQAAYRGYHVRKGLLAHIKPRPKKGPKVELLGPPLDIAESRNIDLGPVLDITVREEDVGVMFDEHAGTTVGLKYDPTRTITNVDDESITAKKSGGKTMRILDTVPQIPCRLLMEAEKSKEVVEDFQEIEAVFGDSRASRQFSDAGSLPGQSQDASLQKISFLPEPPEVINDALEEVPEEPEFPGDMQDEILEESGMELAEATEGTEATQDAIQDAALEVPEDIPLDDVTEGEGDSAPTASVPSSAPLTADDTDVEDTGGLTSEEGE